MMNTKRRKIVQIIPCDPKLLAFYTKPEAGPREYTNRRVACLALVEDPDKIQSVVPMIYCGTSVKFVDEIEGSCYISC